MLLFIAGLIIGFFVGISALFLFAIRLANDISKSIEKEREKPLQMRGVVGKAIVWRKHLENYLNEN